MKSKEIIRQNDKIVIEAGRFAGRNQVSLWKWYIDDKEQCFKPSKQGLTFNPTQSKDLEEFINFLTENKDALINHLLGIKNENIGDQ